MAKKGGCAVKVLLAVLFTTILLFGYMYVEAHLVKLDRVELTLDDLPVEFDGTTILYITDFHAGEGFSPQKLGSLINELSPLNPDMLLLGGDYALEDDMRKAVLSQLADFKAPLLKAGVRGNHDLPLTGFYDALEEGNITPIYNDIVQINKDGKKLLIAGIDFWRFNRVDIRALAKQVKKEDCVILLSHDPDAIPMVLAEQADGGGRWADAIFCGHTHGGQVTLFGLKGLYVNSNYGERYRTGWHVEYGAKILISNGLGSRLMSFRLGAPPQVHFITLRAPSNE